MARNDAHAPRIILKMLDRKPLSWNQVVEFMGTFVKPETCVRKAEHKNVAGFATMTLEEKARHGLIKVARDTVDHMVDYGLVAFETDEQGTTWYKLGPRIPELLKSESKSSKSWTTGILELIREHLKKPGACLHMWVDNGE